MKIVKAINNNVVCALDQDGQEILVMGKGIGFKAKEGQLLNKDLVEKVFKMDNQKSASQFSELLKNLPMEHFDVSNEIIEYAKDTLGKRMNQNIYITLTDHINFAIERFRQVILFQNPLLWEVKKFYPSEYLIGEYAIALIERRLKVKLNVDEAASIALHVVNAEYNTAMNETMHITMMIREVMEIVKTFLTNDLDEESLYYSRFITHLKFLAQRVFTGEALHGEDEKLIEIVTTLYPDEYGCSEKIADYILETYGQVVPREERAYLTLHLKRIRISTGVQETI